MAVLADCFFWCDKENHLFLVNFFVKFLAYSCLSTRKSISTRFLESSDSFCSPSSGSETASQFASPPQLPAGHARRTTGAPAGAASQVEGSKGEISPCSTHSGGRGKMRVEGEKRRTEGCTAGVGGGAFFWGVFPRLRLGFPLRGDASPPQDDGGDDRAPFGARGRRRRRASMTRPATARADDDARRRRRVRVTFRPPPPTPLSFYFFFF